MENAMAMINQIETERIAIDPRNKEVLNELSILTSLLQTNVNILYRRLYNDDTARLSIIGDNKR